MVEEHRFILRGECCARVVTAEMVKEFFSELTIRLNMTIWKGPWAWEMKKKGLEPGVSGAVIWHESGCQFHGYSADKKVTLDIYSCKGFDRNKALELFESYFWPKTINSHTPEI